MLKDGLILPILGSVFHVLLKSGFAIADTENKALTKKYEAKMGATGCPDDTV